MDSTKVFQILNPGGGSKFYYENESGAFVEFTAGNVLGNVNKDEDYSAINYCVESYVFTQWVTKNLGNITVDNMISTTEGQYNNVERRNIYLGLMRTTTQIQKMTLHMQIQY